ncbi:MAG: hypothetical protein M3P11_06360 [Actinomycetota bacterium]|nr:hypothetical protein [Actinomycetota bacterium]
MRAEFHPPDDPDTVLATAMWSDGQVVIQSEDAGTADAVRRAFRPTPVLVDDASRRRQGTNGEVLVQPGDLDWFRAAAQVRVPAETALASRLVPGTREGGYDPASSYRTFDETVERLTSPSA